MKKLRILIVALLIIPALLLVVVTVLAASETYGFNACTNNIAGDVAIGEAQLRVTVTDEGLTPPDQVRFIFENLGPADSSITDIYFDDGSLLALGTIEEGPGTSFSQHADPSNLPGGNNCSPPFVATQDFTADSDPAVQQNGVNPGEWVAIGFTLQSGQTFQDVIADLASGDLRIGIHVQGFASGGSESFVNEGFTAITLASFNVKATRGRTSLSWTTGTEIDNAGFNLYRSHSENGSLVKINSKLIAAMGGAASGASYNSFDAPGYGTFYYWLEDVSNNGVATLHGPVKVTVAPSFRSPIFRPTLPGGY